MPTQLSTQDVRRRLIWHGIFLFLLGLLTGFLVNRAFTNPRMGLSAHLEGVMNGTFLAVLGAVWGELRLPARAATAAFWLALYGTYVNWGATLLAAVFGTSRGTPIAGAGYAAAPWQENLVTSGFLSVAVAITLCCIFLLWGLRGRAAAQP